MVLGRKRNVPMIHAHVIMHGLEEKKNLSNGNIQK